MLPDQLDRRSARRSAEKWVCAVAAVIKFIERICPSRGCICNADVCMYLLLWIVATFTTAQGIHTNTGIAYPYHCYDGVYLMCGEHMLYSRNIYYIPIDGCSTRLRARAHASAQSPLVEWICFGPNLSSTSSFCADDGARAGQVRVSPDRSPVMLLEIHLRAINKANCFVWEWPVTKWLAVMRLFWT